MGAMPRWVRKRIGIRKWIPDTTLRTFACKAVPEGLDRRQSTVVVEFSVNFCR